MILCLSFIFQAVMVFQGKFFSALDAQGTLLKTITFLVYLVSLVYMVHLVDLVYIVCLKNDVQIIRSNS